MPGQRQLSANTLPGYADAAGRGHVGDELTVGSGERAERSGYHRAYVVAAALLIVLNLFDVVITRQALAAGASELNPIARWFVEHAVIAYVIKLGVPAVLFVLASSRFARDRINAVHLAAIWTVVGMYVMTVVLNVVTWMRYA